MKDNINNSTKNIPPAPTINFPTDDSLQGVSEALFTSSQEYTEPIPCEVIGDIPTWVRGTYVRIGPGQYEWGDTKVGHWFDGDALAHRFNIHQGKVTYQSKFLETEYHRKNKKYNRISCIGVGTWAPPDPCASLFQRIAMYFIPKFENDNTNVNVFTIQGKTYAATESPWMLEIDTGTLDTIKRFNARGNLGSATASWLAHPHFEPDGTTWFISTKRYPEERYEIIKIPPTPGKLPLEGIEIFTSLYPGSDERGAGYYHSFCITENYIILITNPLYISGVCDILTMNWTGKTFLDILQYHPEIGPRFRVIDKRTKKELRTFCAQSMFFFHSVNAYETENDVIIDLCSYQDVGIFHLLSMDNCRNAFQGKTVVPPNLVRYRLPIAEILKEEMTEPYQLPCLETTLHNDVDETSPLKSDKETVVDEEATSLIDGNKTDDVTQEASLLPDYEILSGGVELPVINYDKFNGRRYSYCYGITGFIIDTTICKVNVETKETIHWYPPKDIYPSAPVFIARPDGIDEDDGVVVANCTGTNGAQSFFLVLDAKNMQEVGRANMTVNFGAMIHGNFFPDKD